MIDPAGGRDELVDVLLEEGIVARIGPGLSASEVETLDASGLVVAPGLIDIHTHLREPGREDEETIATATRAGAAGGFTTLTAMPNTDPCADSAAVLRFLFERAESGGLVRVEAVGSISKGLEGRELAEMAELAAAGACGFSDDGQAVGNPLLMRRALEYSQLVDRPLIVHCEDTTLSQGGQMHEGYWSTLLGLPGIPAAAEERMVERDLRLAEEFGGRIHITHVSTEGSVELIRSAKARGLPVTCDATPHHLVLTDESVASYSANFKVNPPLRSSENVTALRAGLADGTVDVIATDHAPHAVQEKECEFDLAPPGVIGLETALAVCLTELVPEVLDLNSLLGRLTSAPAGVLGLDRGRLQEGAPADLLVFDPGAEWQVEREQFHSKSKNSPFLGRTLRGRVIHTLVGGRTMVREGALCL